MKILVPTKRVPDTDQKIVATPDGSSVATEHLPFVLNPFDAIALEEAMQISERDVTGSVEVVAVGVGEPDYQQQLRTALAMGATRAICVECRCPLDPWNVARLLKAVVEREQPDLVLMGKQAVDDDANQTGQFLAALLDWSQATFASRLEFQDKQIRVNRETDHGIETIELPLPAVVTVDLRLNEPRYASMAGIMKAKKKPLDVIAAEDLGVPLEPRVEVLGYRSADTRRKCQRMGTVEELAQQLLQLTGRTG
jgi:electron transfer flavoprotein beta subunit